MRPTIWEMLAECVAHLPEPFGRSGVTLWSDWHYPGTNHSSISTHLQSAASNASERSRMPTHPPPDDRKGVSSEYFAELIRGFNSELEAIVAAMGTP